MPNSNGKLFASTRQRHSQCNMLYHNPVAFIQCCCHRLQNGQDEGRDAFKSLKNQQIADKSALLYTQWADLEVKTGMLNITHPES